MNARGSVNDVRSINGDSMLDKKAPGIERLADRFRTNDRLMASAGEHLMTPHNDRLSSQNDRLLTSSSGMKPPPGISQPPNMAVTPANVSAALADYERKKVMASKGNASSERMYNHKCIICVGVHIGSYYIPC